MFEAAVQLAIAAVGLRSGGFEGFSAAMKATIAMTTPYPPTILGSTVRLLAFTLLPVAYVAYLPTGLLLGLNDAYGSSAAAGSLGLLVGPAPFGLALLLRRGRVRC